MRDENLLPVCDATVISSLGLIVVSKLTLTKFIIMAALRSTCGHFIFALWFILSFFYLLSLFPRLFSAVADWMPTIHGVALVRT